MGSSLSEVTVLKQKNPVDHDLKLVIMSYLAEIELKIKYILTSLLLQKNVLLKHGISFQIKNIR